MELYSPCSTTINIKHYSLLLPIPNFLIPFLFILGGTVIQKCSLIFLILNADYISKFSLYSSSTSKYVRLIPSTISLRKPLKIIETWFNIGCTFFLFLSVVESLKNAMESIAAFSAIVEGGGYIGYTVWRNTVYM